MPAEPMPRLRPHPKDDVGDPIACPTPIDPDLAPPYAELEVTSNFTFLTGASHPEEFAAQAAVLGHRAIAVTDVNTLSGIVRGHLGAVKHNIPYLVGCRLRFLEPVATTVLVYPTNVAAYGRLCQLLTIGKRRAPKGDCHLTVQDLLAHHQGLLAVAVPPADLNQIVIDTIEALRRTFDDDRLSIAISRHYSADDDQRLDQLRHLSAHTNVPLVVTNAAHYHIAQRRPLQDAVTCVRLGCTLQTAGRRLQPNAERMLKSAVEMAALFPDDCAAIARTVEIATRASSFSLDELKYEYPDEICPDERSPIEYLRQLAWCGAADRFPQGVNDQIRTQLNHELSLIDELNYAPYFLTVYDIVTFARSRGILCQGRGAAANSAVCYCLGLTSVDPGRIEMLFERFISRERNEPPDIDIDFEHERREEVIQYIYQKYGRDRAALTAEVITYRPRSAVRELGKVLGLSRDAVDRLAKDFDWWDDGGLNAERVQRLGLDPSGKLLRQLAWLVGQLLGFPRHLSQHVGGFVITRRPLSELVPIENAAMDDRTVIEWDKDDIDAMGMLKVDVLGLGMLTCIRKAFDLIADTHGQRYTLATVPPEDPRVYDMICDADTVGVFQIESRAQMSMLPRLRPRCYYDLVIEVAIVRPGPIQGKMVHPYLKRRNDPNREDYYPNDDVRRVLKKTLGVPLFQEQAMALAIVAAGFTPGEADELRRAMAAWKRKGDLIYTFGQRLIKGMIERGYDTDFAERCFEQIKGFADYGFPESHAASFALLVYVSSWIKHWHPAAFAAALINSQPMGFYAPAQLVRDAREHGVEIREIDVNHSHWDCTLESTDDPDRPALRLGLRLVKGLQQVDADAITNAVLHVGHCTSIDMLQDVSGVRVATLQRLASADAFQSMGLDRQTALWHVRALRDEALPLFDGVIRNTRYEAVALPAIAATKQVEQDYRTTGLSLKAHPMTFLRDRLESLGATPAGDLRDDETWRHGMSIAVAGIVLVRQRPSTAKGILFMTIEDESGAANLIIRPEVFERFRPAARHGVVILVRGRVERANNVVHVMAKQIHDLTAPDVELSVKARNFH
ncbi:MAG: error-prone DNA polymerase [Planctomycetota bacterium]